MPRLEKFIHTVVLSWDELVPLLDGTTATLPYLEGFDDQGHPEIAAIDGIVVYTALLLGTAEQAAWVALKPGLVAYLNQSPSLVSDSGQLRLAIEGKVAVVGAFPPPATSPFAVIADAPLVVGSHDTIFVIPDGETAHLQQLTAGNEDPTKGASVEIIYDDGGIERLIARVYTAGFSVLFSFADVSAARDGTPLVGDAGGTKRIIIRRLKFSGTDIAIDCVTRGYTV